MHDLPSMRSLTGPLGQSTLTRKPKVSSLAKWNLWEWSCLGELSTKTPRKCCALPDHVLLDSCRWSRQIYFLSATFCENFQRRPQACFEDSSHWTSGIRKSFKFIPSYHDQRACNWFESYIWDSTQIYCRLVFLSVAPRDCICSSRQLHSWKLKQVRFYLHEITGGAESVSVQCGIIPASWTHSWINRSGI